MAMSRARRRLLLAGLGAGAIVCLVLLGIASVFVVTRSERQMEMDAAKWPSNYVPSGRALARLAWSVPFEMRDGKVPFGDGWVPIGLRRLHGDVDVTPDGATASFGDRDHPFGYALTPAPGKGDPRSRPWELTYESYRLDAPLKLMTFHYAAKDAWTPAELASRATRVYDRRLAAHPKDASTLEARSLILATLGSCAAAERATEDAVRRRPRWWWPHLVLALVEWQRGDHRDADAEMNGFARAHPSYSSFAYLAHYDRLTGRPKLACEAMTEAVAHPLHSKRTDLMNATALGYGIARDALAHGRFPCAAHVARALASGETDRYTRTFFALPLRSIRAAALYRSGKRAAAAKVVAAPRPKARIHLDPSMVSRYRAMAEAIRSGDDAAVAAWRPAPLGDFDDEAFFGLGVRLPLDGFGQGALGCGFLGPASGGRSPAPAPAPRLRKIADVPLPGSPSRFDYASLDPATGRLYLDHMGAGTLLVFDVHTRLIVGEVSGLSRCTGVLAVPSLGRIFVSAAGAGEVVAIDAKTLRVLARLRAPGFPDGLAYDPVTKRLFASEEAGSAVTVIDPVHLKILGRIPLGGEAGNTQVDPKAGRVYTCEQTHGSLVVLDPKALTVRRRIPLGVTGTHGLYLDLPAHLAFVASEDHDVLLVVDLRTSKVTERLPVGHVPDVLAFDPGRGRLYVASESGVVSIYELDGRRLVHEADLDVGHNAHVVAVDPKTHLVYLPLRSVGGRPVLRIMAPAGPATVVSSPGARP